VYDRSNGTVLTFQNASITGSIFHNQDALLDNGVNEALAASAHAFSLTPNRPNTSVKLLGNHALTITGAPGETVVLSLKNVKLRGSSRVLHPPILSPLVDTVSEADFDRGSRDDETGESLGRGVMSRKLK